LNQLAHFVERHVYPTGFDARVGGFAGRVQQRLKLVVKAKRPCAVNDAAIDLSPKVNRHHVAVVEHRVVPTIGGVMRGDVVHAAARGKPNPGGQARLLHQLAVFRLDFLAHVQELDARLDPGLRPAPHLPVHFRRVPHCGVQVFFHPLQCFLFFAARPERVAGELLAARRGFIRVRLFFAFREWERGVGRKQLRHGNRRLQGLAIPV